MITEDCYDDENFRKGRPTILFITDMGLSLPDISLHGKHFFPFQSQDIITLSPLSAFLLIASFSIQ